MKAVRNMIIGLARRDRSEDMLEFALIAGLIVVAAVAMIGSAGTKVMAKWQEATGGGF